MGFFTTGLGNGFSVVRMRDPSLGGNRCSHRRHDPALRGSRRIARVALLAAVAAALVLALAGCEPAGSGLDRNLPIGTWDAAGGWGDRYVITRTTIEHFGREAENGPLVSNYKAEIVAVNDSALNGGDTAIKKNGPTAIGPGFAVFRYTQVKNASSGEVGRFNVFRWATNATDTSKRDMGQGGTYNDDYTIMYVFASSSEAINGATIANGHFGLVSESLTTQ